MAKQTRREIYITCNGKSADDMLRTLTNHAAQLDAQIKKLIADGKGNTKECKELVSVHGQLSKQLKQNISNTQMIDKVMRNLAGSNTAQLRNALQAVRREMSRTSESSGKLPQLRKQMEAIKAQIDKNTGAIHKQGGAWSTAMKNLTAYVGLFAVFNKVKLMLSGVIKENFQMSDSLADIRKVSGLLSQDIDKMAISLAKIDTRTPVSELQKIAYAGAKLGIGNYGAEGLESFVKASNQVNMALKEDLGDEALTALSKITEVMGLIPKMGVEQSMLKTGSAIFKLASTTTATSNKIIDFSNRLLAMGKTGALSTADILALGAAVDSMAMEPEVASTAFSKMITEMRKGTNLLEKDLGLASGSLKELLEQGKGMEALQTIFHKMHDTGNVFALDGLFKDLGSDGGARLIKVMVTMAEKVDMLDKVVQTSRDAFNEGIAVTQEYNIQQQTAQGILERANNMWTKAFVNPDGINSVKQMAIEWYNLSRALTQSSYAQKSALFTLETITTSLEILINLMPALIGYLAGRGLVRGFLALKNIATAVWAWVTAQKALNLAMSSNVIGAVIAVLSLAYTWFQKDANAAKDAADSADKFTKSLSSAKNEVGKAVAELDSYKRAINGAKKGTKERQAVIDNFNKKFGSYLSKLLTEKSTAKDLAKAYNEVANAIERKVMAEMRTKDIKQHVEPKAGRSAQLLYDYDEKAKALGMGGYGGDWLNAFVSDNLTKRGTSYTINEYLRRSGVGKNKNSQARKALFAALRNTNGAPADTYTWQYTDKNAGGGKRTSSVRTPYSDIEKLVAMGVAYIHQKAAQVKSEQEVKGKYKFYKLDDVVTEDVSGVTVSEKPDKDAIKREKQEKRDRERAWREELKQKQDEANAIMDNVRNFYERQINAKMEQAIQLGMNKSEQNFFVEPLKQRMNEALEQVRLAIAGQANTWEQFKLAMKDDLIEQTDETGVNLSEGLLKGITTTNIDALRKKLEGLANSLGRPINSVMAEVFAKATKNAQANLSLVTQQKEARRKAIQEHDYTGVVQQNAYDLFNSMGYANPTEKETAVKKTVVDGKEVYDTSAFDKRKENIIAMFEKARTDINKVYSIDVSNEEGRGLLMKLLFGDDPDGMAKRISETLGKDAEEWQGFYRKLLQYNDEYESASKKGDDERKKLNDYGWSNTDYYKEYQKALPGAEQEVAVKGSYRNAGQRMGMESVSGSDPELELMKARMEFAEQYYKFLEEHNASELHLADARKSIMAEQANYAKKLTGDMFEQYNSLLTFMGPLQTFGESVGDAFATMTENAAEGRKALKTALKQMVKSFATNTLQMISQQQIDRAQTTAHYTQLLLMQQAFGTAQVQGQVANGEAMIAADEATHLTEQQLEGIHQQVMAALRSAGIFGWCVSTLGPIAGPIAYSAMMATLMGLLNFAISKIGGGDKMNNSSSGKNTKIVSGMLTYDSGNVQDLKPFVGNDGSLYWATEDNKPHNGVSLLTQPTATTINDQPSLVAENGPELVIGRETTQAMMMNNPQLLKALVNYDRNYSGRSASRRAFDNGNVGETIGNLPSGASATDDLLTASTASNAALLQAVEALLVRLNEPIEARIDMYGRGKLYDSMTKANQFMKNKS